MNEIYAIGTDQSHHSKLYGIDPRGTVTALFSVGSRFAGGLAFHPKTQVFYAIAQDAAGASSLYRTDLNGNVQLVRSLGTGFTGGLAYRAKDQNFYAIASDAANKSTLYMISPGAGGAITPLFTVGQHFVGGLAYDAAHDLFYAISTDASGFSNLYAISLDHTVKQLFGVAMHVLGGLSYQAEQKLFYLAAGQQDSDLVTIALSGASLVMGIDVVGVAFDSASLCVSPWFGASIQVQSPLDAERFVTGEELVFDASVLDASGTYQVSDGKGLTWSSNLDGQLGTGTVTTTTLSVGTHNITVVGHDLQTEFTVRVFTDLWQLYLAQPSPGEVKRIEGDFNIQWVDSSTTDPTQEWATYPGYPFDTSSAKPTRMAVISKLDVLRHQRFSQPLPFGDTLTAYEHVRSHTTNIDVNLGSDVNDAAGGTINCNRSFALWSNTSGPNPPPALYCDSLYLFMHESRHNEPADPGHVSCPLSWKGLPGIPHGMDEHFEPGSGYAWASLYLMWVYKYGIYDPPAVRAQAKLDLHSHAYRFCQTPSSTNPLVEALIQELWKP